MKFKVGAILMKTLVVGLLAFTSVLTAGRTQQMQDMPFDLHFIDMMIMHHQEGVEMAELAQTKAQSAKVKAFATKTATDQKKEIEELQAHRNHWYAGKPLMDHSMMESMMQKMHPGMKMDMEDTRRKLRAATGVAFDRLFLDTMIHHHMMAVDMSKEATNKAEHSEIKEFAKKAIAKQTAEISEMKRLKGGSTTASKIRTTKAKPKTTTSHKH